MDDNRMLPEWVVVLFAILGFVGSGAAAAWAWWTKARDKEAAKVGKPYRELFKDIQSELAKTRAGLQLLQEEHITCREHVARLETRLEAVEGRGAGRGTGRGSNP